MTPGRLRRCTAWLLPFLVARLLVPTGFMLSLSDAGLDIVLCTGLAPSSAPLVAQDEHDRHAGIDHAAHAMQRDTQTQIPAPGPDHPNHANPICPFALAGGAVVAPACRGVAEPQRLVALLPGPSADPAWIEPAVLIDRIRGPPFA
jgi:hypothetical protein